MSVHFNWNVLPSTRLEASQLSTPVACLFTPKDSDVVLLDPIACSNCKNYLNPYIKIDRVNSRWLCPFCNTLEPFPSNYKLPPASPANNTDIPAELRFPSIDYEVPNDISLGWSEGPPVSVFIIDTYQHTEGDFSKLKEAVCSKIDLLSPDSLVMIVTFAENVQIGERIQIKAGDFTGISESKTVILNKTLLSENIPLSWQDSPLVKQKLLTDKASAKSILDLLAPTPSSSYKPPRATGLAAYVVSVLLSLASYRGFNGQVDLFTSGPGTVSPGKIVDQGSNIRSHHDIANLTTPFLVDSLRFYSALGLVSCGHSMELAANCSQVTELAQPPVWKPRFSFSVFSGLPDQVGVYEMKQLVLASCGNIYLNESFSTVQFQKNLLRSLAAKKNCKLTVATSKGLMVLKFLAGHGLPLPSSYQQDSDLSKLQSEKISDHMSQFDPSTKKTAFTNQWWYNQLDDSTLGITFDVKTVLSSAQLNSFNGIKEVFVQFKLHYWDEKSKRWRLKVTTVTKKTTLSMLASNQVKLTDGTMRLVNTKSKIIKERELFASFDSRVWTVILARLMINQIDSDIGYGDFTKILKQADNTLVRLLYHFGGVTVDYSNADTNPYARLMTMYKINENFKQLPSLLYNLRRNHQLIQVFNTSPDETAYYHSWMMNADTELSCTMIEPKMVRLQDDSQTTVLTDASVLQLPEDSLLIMDTVFNVVIYYVTPLLRLHPSDNENLVYGEEHTKILKNLDFHRKLEPKYILTQKGHSQARHLVARLSPELNFSAQPKKKSGLTAFFSSLKLTEVFSYDLIHTDEMSLKEYYQGLVELVKRYRPNSDY